MFSDMFKGAQGRVSSKRVLGALMCLFSMVLTLYIVISSKTEFISVLAYPYGLTATLIGIGVAEKQQRKTHATKETRI